MDKKLTLKKRKEFQDVFEKGNSVATRGLVLYRLPNQKNGNNRTGYIVTKKLGNAVRRNYIRRILKEAFRMYAGEIKHGYDLVFIARPPAATFNYKQAAEEMKQVLRKGGLFAHIEKR